MHKAKPLHQCSLCILVLISAALSTREHLCLQVLGLGTDCGECTPSVLLFFDKQR